MKLNSTTEMQPCSFPHFTELHPFCPQEQAQGYKELFEELEHDLCEITGYDKISFQPNRWERKAVQIQGCRKNEYVLSVPFSRKGCIESFRFLI